MLRKGESMAVGNAEVLRFPGEEGMERLNQIHPLVWTGEQGYSVGYFNGQGFKPLDVSRTGIQEAAKNGINILPFPTRSGGVSPCTQPGQLRSCADTAIYQLFFQGGDVADRTIVVDTHNGSEYNTALLLRWDSWSSEGAHLIEVDLRENQAYSNGNGNNHHRFNPAVLLRPLQPDKGLTRESFPYSADNLRVSRYKPY